MHGKHDALRFLSRAVLSEYKSLIIHDKTSFVLKKDLYKRKDSDPPRDALARCKMKFIGNRDTVPRISF